MCGTYTLSHAQCTWEWVWGSSAACSHPVRCCSSVVCLFVRTSWQVLKDPRQKRLFAAKDLHDLFTLGEQYAKRSSTQAAAEAARARLASAIGGGGGSAAVPTTDTPPPQASNRLPTETARIFGDAGHDIEMDVGLHSTADAGGGNVGGNRGDGSDGSHGMAGLDTRPHPHASPQAPSPFPPPLSTSRNAPQRGSTGSGLPHAARGGAPSLLPINGSASVEREDRGGGGGGGGGSKTAVDASGVKGGDEDFFVYGSGKARTKPPVAPRSRIAAAAQRRKAEAAPATVLLPSSAASDLPALGDTLLGVVGPGRASETNEALKEQQQEPAVAETRLLRQLFEDAGVGVW
jgi:hypothetical protein